MTSCSSTRNDRPRSDSSTSLPMPHTVPAHNHECAEQEHANEEIPGPRNKPEDGFISPGVVIKDKEMVITSIRATDLALGLRRLPVGFYTSVYHSGLEWRTKNKPVLVDNDDIEWSEPIPIPSESSTSVCLAVYASFEFQPMLGGGEQLRELTITVEQLVERSARHLPFAFYPRSGDIVSPCSSLSVTIRRRDRENSGLAVLEPQRPIMGLEAQLANTTNSGHSALSRYRKYTERQDLEDAIKQFEHALNICPMGHPCYAAALSNMAVANFLHCQAYSTNPSFRGPLAMYRDALTARPVGHPDRPCTLIQLAAVHLAQFEKQDDSDAVQVEAYLREVTDLISEASHEHRAATLMVQLHKRHMTSVIPTDAQSSAVQGSALGATDVDLQDLGSQLLSRYQQFGDLSDLQEAISCLEVYIKSTSAWDSGYLAGIGNLGVALRFRFDRLGELSDLEEAISRQRDAVNLTPDNHPQKPSHLNNLGTSFLTRFERLGQLPDLEEAISRQRDADNLTPNDHPQKPRHLNDLGASFVIRFESLGQLPDLEEAISRQRGAVNLTLDDHPRKPGYLNNLGNFFAIRFECLGRLSDLEEAISRHRNAVTLTPVDHPDMPLHLNNLGNSILTRFKHLGQLPDLEEAISRQQDVVDLTPDNHPQKPNRLNHLANSFFTRFEHLGQLPDLEEAISRQRDVVSLTPDNHPQRPGYLNNLGAFFVTRFMHLGQLPDLEEGLLRQRDAVDLTPDNHPQKPSRLKNLGTSFRTRFEHLGQLSDLEEAISRQRDAVNITPDDHPDMPGHLINLGNSFLTRFKHLEQLPDLEEAISRQWDAVNLTPDNHPQKPSHLNNLGISFATRFEYLGQLSDLEDAISKHRDAVDLTPNDHPQKPRHLNNLGKSFLTRFESLGQLPDLEEAILRQRGAVDLTPNNHPRKPICLNNLGNCFVSRFKHLGQLSDLEEGISKQQDAVNLAPSTHPDMPGLLSNLGNSFLTRFECLREQNDIEQAIVLYSNAARTSSGPTAARFDASRQWIYYARLLGHSSLLSAYSVTIHLLPQLAWIGLSLAHRCRALIKGSDIAREAAAAALDSGCPETAVEWLEQGRAVIWGELFQLRSSYDELSSAYPDHARRLRDLSTALEQAGAMQEKSMYPRMDQAYGGDRRAMRSLQQEADKHRMLAIERDKLLQDIRTLPGFERFLLHKEFSQLRASAHSGPVVILNAADTRCDALIVLADVDHVIHVPLPSFTLEKCKEFQSVVYHTRGVFPDDRYGYPAEQEGRSKWEPVLASLWKCVVKPVLDALALSTPGDLLRIFWCPTGPLTFLPIHATGFYGARFSEPGHKVFDFVISSYVPTLSILAPSPQSESPDRDGLRLLVVRQPFSDGQPKLPGVHAELENVKTVLRDSLLTQATLTEPSVGTVEEVLELMKNADWVHFACHGVQDNVNPSDSGLCLADKGRLKISDIIALSRPHGGLAFLSACQTAKGDEDISDEAIHIAAGMLFAGFGGVVGTMWSISDSLAPAVAKDVYEQLFQDGSATPPNYWEAARALHVAVGRLRERKVPFEEWLPFIHLGL